MSEATHEPPHETSPDAHAHEPFSHVVPVPQIVPHAPQFWLSVARTMHAVPHAVWPTAHRRPGGAPLSVELPSGTPPSVPNPGSPFPALQLATTKITEETSAAKAQGEKRRPSMSRLLTKSGTGKARSRARTRGTSYTCRRKPQPVFEPIRAWAGRKARNVACAPQRLGWMGAEALTPRPFLPAWPLLSTTETTAVP
jgi:hypothetical protein